MDTVQTSTETQRTAYAFLKINSEAFEQNGMIPERHTCDGADENPSLHIDGIPEEAKTLAIIVEDPDAPGGTFCHWLVWNLPLTRHIKQNESRGIEGMNDFSRRRYNGPCPPPGIHRYEFKVYALDCALNLPPGSGKSHVEDAMKGHVLAFGAITGRYSRNKS